MVRAGPDRFALVHFPDRGRTRRVLECSAQSRTALDGRRPPCGPRLAAHRPPQPSSELCPVPLVCRDSRVLAPASTWLAGRWLLARPERALVRS